MKKLAIFILFSSMIFSEYEIKSKNVYFNSILLKDAQSSSFEVIDRDSDYGKDAYNVYYKGNKLLGADPLSFTYIVKGTIESLYFKDKKNIYYEGIKIERADFKSFKILGSGYSVDKNTAYYEGKKIRGSDSKTFKVSRCEIQDEHDGCPYSKDKNYNYYRGTITNQ